MKSKLDVHIESLTDSVYRLRLAEPDGFIAFSHFLVVDEFPLLMHLGQQQSFPALREAIGEILDPATIRYLAFSHYEADECGALNDWLALATKAETLTGPICAMTLNDFILRAPRVLQDNETVSLGRERIKFLETPHFPHNWDACLFYLETSRILFGSDLGTQLGPQPLFSNEDPTSAAISVQEKFQYMPWGIHLAKGLERVKALDFEILATMHGSVFKRSQADWLLTMLAQANQREMEAWVASLQAGKSLA